MTDDSTPRRPRRPSPDQERAPRRRPQPGADPRTPPPRRSQPRRQADPRRAAPPRRAPDPRQEGQQRPEPRRPPAEPAGNGPHDAGGYPAGYDPRTGHGDAYHVDGAHGYDDIDELDLTYHDRRRGLFLVVGLLLVALVCVGGYALLGDEVREFVTGSSGPDYAGDGNGTEVLITIIEGDTGADVARTLRDEGVTKSFEAFYELLLAQSNDVTFQPGVYSLEAEMSAQSALDAFRDPTTRVTNRIVIREGLSADDAFALLSDASGIPVADFEGAVADPAALGLPPEAPGIEGFLFPATYELEPDATAAGLVKMMVDEMLTRLDDAGVAPGDRFRVITLASVIQREAGSVDEDFYKVSRVFHNRLDAGWRLESDATVAYGTGHYDSVFTTDAERADASNPYNTYANDGLPVGPIGLPGELAIDAAANPVDGPWFYFVTVNLQTGETKFSEDLSQHNAAVQELRDWCNASEENASYCE